MVLGPFGDAGGGCSAGWPNLGAAVPEATGRKGPSGIKESCFDAPKGLIVVPFWGSYIESYKVIPKRNYYGASG